MEALEKISASSPFTALERKVGYRVLNAITLLHYICLA
jgi:hypothetical protein